MKKSIGSVSVTPSSSETSATASSPIWSARSPNAWPPSYQWTRTTSPWSVSQSWFVVAVGLGDLRPDPLGAVLERDPELGRERRVRDDVAVGNVARVDHRRRPSAERRRLERRRARRCPGPEQDLDPGRRRRRARPAARRRSTRRRSMSTDGVPNVTGSAATTGPARDAADRGDQCERHRRRRQEPSDPVHSFSHARPAMRVIPSPFSWAPSSPVRDSVHSRS